MDSVEFLGDDEPQWSSANSVQTNTKRRRKRTFDIALLQCTNAYTIKIDDCSDAASERKKHKIMIRKRQSTTTTTTTNHVLKFSVDDLDEKVLNSDQLHILLEPFFRLNIPIGDLDPKGEGYFKSSDIYVVVYIIALNRGLIFSQLKVNDFFITPNVIINNMFKEPAYWSPIGTSKKRKTKKDDIWTEALRTASGVFNCCSKSEIFKIPHMLIPVCNFRRSNHNDNYLFYLIYRYSDSLTQSVRYFSFDILDNEPNQDLFTLSSADNKSQNITSMDRILELSAGLNDQIPSDFDMGLNYMHVIVKYTNEANNEPMISKLKSNVVLYCNRTRLYDRLIGLIHFLFTHKNSIDSKLFNKTRSLDIDCSNADLKDWSSNLLEFEPGLNDIHALRNHAQLSCAKSTTVQRQVPHSQVQQPHQPPQVQPPHQPPAQSTIQPLSDQHPPAQSTIQPLSDQHLFVQPSTNLQSSNTLYSNGIIFDLASQRKGLQSTKTQLEEKLKKLQSEIVKSKANQSKLLSDIKSCQDSGNSVFEQSMTDVRSIYSGYHNSLEIRSEITTRMKTFYSNRNMSMMLDKMDCLEQNYSGETNKYEGLVTSQTQISGQVEQYAEFIDQLDVEEAKLTDLQTQIKTFDEKAKKISELIDCEQQNSRDEIDACLLDMINTINM